MAHQLRQITQHVRRERHRQTKHLRSPLYGNVYIGTFRGESESGVGVHQDNERLGLAREPAFDDVAE